MAVGVEVVGRAFGAVGGEAGAGADEMAVDLGIVEHGEPTGPLGAVDMVPGDRAVLGEDDGEEGPAGAGKAVDVVVVTTLEDEFVEGVAGAFLGEDELLAAGRIGGANADAVDILKVLGEGVDPALLAFFAVERVHGDGEGAGVFVSVLDEGEADLAEIRSALRAVGTGAGGGNRRNREGCEGGDDPAGDKEFEQSEAVF